jgi:acetyl-CoA acetyltransferase
VIEGVEIAGVGMHPFGRFPDHSLKDLARVATLAALDDAQIGVEDIEAVYAANSLAGVLTRQEQIRGQTVMREIGIEGVPVVNVENACASGSTALREAVVAVRAGVVSTALAVGYEKMYVGDREASLAALRSAADLDVVEGLGVQFTAVYALRLRARIDSGHLTLDDLVDVSVKSHACGARNPYAQFRAPVTREQVLDSPAIAEPLTLMMCSAICDGAAAVVVTAGGAAPRSGRPRVAVRASQLRSGVTWDAERSPSVGELTIHQAYEEAGVGPEDIQVFEVHDAMAPAELIAYEHLGLCEPGQAGALLRSGTTSLRGVHVVNPSGGLSSRGHPVGATGLAQVVELVWQLRGEAKGRQVPAARFALAQNSGGWLEGDSAAAAVHILERVAA